ncbi:MAG: acidic tetraheme cytochrome c3 TmcA [Desulfatibacillaceae bacterium]
MRGHTKTFCVVLGVCLVLLGAMAAFSQEDVTEVDDSIFLTRMRPPVPFNHEEHNEKAELWDCIVCHHYGEEDELIPDMTSEGMECSECHYEGDGFPMDVVRAYHLNCRGCHKERKQGPVTCGQCHPRE